MGNFYPPPAHLILVHFAIVGVQGAKSLDISSKIDT